MLSNNWENPNTQTYVSKPQAKIPKLMHQSFKKINTNSKQIGNSDTNKQPNYTVVFCYLCKCANSPFSPYSANQKPLSSTSCLPPIDGKI